MDGVLLCVSCHTHENNNNKNITLNDIHDILAPYTLPTVDTRGAIYFLPYVLHAKSTVTA